MREGTWQVAGRQLRGVASFPPAFLLPTSSKEDLPQGTHQEPCPGAFKTPFPGSQRADSSFSVFPGISWLLSAQAAWPQLVHFCPPSQCWGADACPPEGVQGARMARWHLNCACCRMQLGKAPVVHGPSSWLLCEVTCTFSFGSIEADTLIWGPEGPLGRKGHHESCRGRYVWESQVT